MALEHLLTALEREASATAERLLAEARAEAERITAASIQASDERREAEVKRVERERRSAMETKLAAARHAGRGEILRARDRFLARVEGAVRERLPATLARPDYRSGLAAKVAAGLASLDPEAKVVLHCPAALSKAIREALPGARAIEVRADETVGSGFRLGTLDGAVEVEDTLESRFEAMRGVLAREALRIPEGTT